MGAEEFQPKFQAADMGANALGKLARIIGIGRIQRYVDGIHGFIVARPVQKRKAAFCQVRLVGFAAIQALAQFLARTEKRRALLANRNRLARARIAPHAAGTHLHAEGAEAAQFHPMAFGQRFADAIQYRRHDAFHIAVVQVRIASGEPCNQF
jgi:hypothetical protein